MRASQPDIAELIVANYLGEDVDLDDLEAATGYAGDDLDAGLSLQVAVLERLLARGEKLGGYKIGLTSREQLDSLGVGYRPFGFVLERRLIPSGSTLELASIRDGHIEQEVCLTIGSRLHGPNVTPEQAKAAVRAVAPSQEIVENRFPKVVTPTVRLGNAISNWGIVVGEERDKDIDLYSLSVTLSHNDTVVEEGEFTSSIINDPYVSLSRVCGELSKFGLALEEGQRVITGSVLAAPALSLGEFRADFGALGVATVTFV